VLTFTASEADLRKGLLLLLAYSFGLAVPFLLASLMIERFMSLFQRYRGALVWMSRISGLLLISIGVLMITGSMTVLSGWLQGFTPEFLKSRL
jgi:cytochrome c-type biogenesis protein